MTNNRGRIAQLLFGCAISAAVIAYLALTIRWDAVLGQLQAAQPWWLVGVAACTLLALWPRAARWQVLFLPGDRVPLRPLLSTLAISYMASTFLPFRAGEVARVLFLAQRQQLPASKIVGTILLEKLFDFLAIGVMLVLLLAFVPLPPLAIGAATSVATAIIVGFGFVVGLAVWRRPTVRCIGWLQSLLPHRLRTRLPLAQLAEQFADGLDSLRSPLLWVQLLAWTALAWALSLVGFWCAGRAIGLNISLPANGFVAVVTSTSQAVPSSPGYLGVFQGAVVLALSTFGVNDAAAAALAILAWALTYPSLVVVGLLALFVDRYRPSDLLLGLRGPAGAATRPRFEANPGL